MVIRKMKNIYRYYQFKKIVSKTKRVLDFVFSDEFKLHYWAYLSEKDRQALDDLKARLTMEKRTYLKPAEIQLLKEVKKKILIKKSDSLF